MTELTREVLVETFRTVGVEPGDVLLVHSSYKSLGGVHGGPATVIDAFLEILGPDGTLVMPTFNFDFCRGVPFDARETPSQMGVLTELVRTRPDARRVPHPIYSFAVLGARADECAQIRNTSSYGPDSLFAKLHEWDGKILVIGLSWNDSMTFFHHVEELEGCDYRFMKEFTGEYTDVDGSRSTRTFTMLVRDIDRGVQTMVDPMGALLEQHGVARVGRVGGATIKLVRASELYEFTKREMRREPGLLYRIGSSGV